MHHHHRHADQAGQQRERLEELVEVAFVFGPQRRRVEAERHAEDDIAHRHAEHQRGHHAAEAQHRVPAAAPARALHLAAVLETHRPQDQGDEDQHHGQVKTRERGRIQQRPGREDRPAGGDQPDLVAFPYRADHVEHHAPLDIGLGDQRQKRRHAQIETVHHGEADQQRAQQQPPEHAQGGVVERNQAIHVRSPHQYASTAAWTGSARRPAGSLASPFGPALTACSITLTPITSSTV